MSVSVPPPTCMLALLKVEVSHMEHREHRSQFRTEAVRICSSTSGALFSTSGSVNTNSYGVLKASFLGGHVFRVSGSAHLDRRT